MRRNHRGISLFELTLVITLTAVIAAFALPTFLAPLKEARAAYAETTILRLLKFAESSARSRQHSVILCKSRSGQTCDGAFEDGELLLLADPITQKETPLLFNKLSGTLHWQSYPIYRAAIVFTPEGRMTSDNATLWYCTAKGVKPTFAIMLGHAGHMRVIHPDAKGEIYDSKKRLLQCVN